MMIYKYNIRNVHNNNFSDFYLRMDSAFTFLTIKQGIEREKF